MGSGCGDPIVESVPSSSGQLPVPVALNAGSPTLFMDTIQEKYGKVNRKMEKEMFFRGIPVCYADNESCRRFSPEHSLISLVFPVPRPVQWCHDQI